MSSADGIPQPHENDRLIDNSMSDNASEPDSDGELDGYVGSHQRAFSLLIEAMFALIMRLWLATLTVSILMYFLRRIPVHPLVHHSGSLMSEREADLVISDDYILPVTPALFGKILGKPIKGMSIFSS